MNSKRILGTAALGLFALVGTGFVQSARADDGSSKTTQCTTSPSSDKDGGDKDKDGVKSKGDNDGIKCDTDGSKSDGDGIKFDKDGVKCDTDTFEIDGGDKDGKDIVVCNTGDKGGDKDKSGEGDKDGGDKDRDGKDKEGKGGAGCPPPVGAVPEPGSLALLGLGGIGLVTTALRARKGRINN